MLRESPTSRARRSQRGILFSARVALMLATACVAAVPLESAQQPSAGAASPGQAKCETLTADSVAALPDAADSSAQLMRCGKERTDREDYKGALPLFTAAVQVAERRADRKGLLDALASQGDMYRLLGDNDRADVAFQRALALSRELRDRNAEAEALTHLGRLRTQQSRRPEALEFHKQALAIYEEQHDAQGIAIANNNVGIQYRYRGDYTTALPYLDHSLKALNALGDQRRAATVLVNIASIYDNLGDYDRARDLLTQSLVIRRALDDSEGIAKSLESLAFNDEARGDYAAALDGLQKCLQLRRDHGLAFGTAEALNNIGVLYRLLGNYDQAVRYLRQASAAATRLRNAGLTAEVLTNLGEIHFLRGEMTAARGSLTLALATAEKDQEPISAMSARLELGRLDARTHRLQQARDTLSRCVDYYAASGARRDKADALVELADVERRLGRTEHGLELAGEAERLADAMDVPEIQWRALTATGRLDVALGRRDDANVAFEHAISVIEGLRDRVGGGEETRSAFLESRLAPYRERIATALAQSRTDDAFQFAERSKARALLDVIRHDHFPATATMSGAERARETDLRNSLSSINSQILVAAQAPGPDPAQVDALKKRRTQARLDYEDFQSTLYAAHSELRMARAAVPVVDAEGARRLLSSPGSAILEFVIGRHVWAFAVTTAGVRAFRLPVEPAALAADVQTFRRQLASRDLRATVTARVVFDHVLGPMREVLRGRTNLVVVPDGVLWDLPFQALQPSPGHYLIEDTAIAYAPSATVLRETRNEAHRSSDATLLAFGNPAFGAAAVHREKLALMGDQLTPLPEAEEQVREIGALYGPGSRVYVGGDATEDRWKAEAARYRILHLATHGVVDSRSPLYSYVVLARPVAGSTDDGLLEAWEVMNLHLNADLVVLSACETARGHVSGGEGVIGMMWAFFVAGSPATIVSQWQVEAASSTTLMVAFHKAWKGGRGDVSKAQALQRAAVQVMHDPARAHPFYWAGYILVGDGL